MMKIKSIYFLIGTFLVLLISSCEPNNPFDAGPTYDVEANLEIDREKIEEYLATAEIDSLYRVYDRGVVVIVQEEGVGTRPVAGSVVYADYTGSLISDGTVFDTSIESVAIENDIFNEDRTYQPIEFSIGTGGVIPGWDIGFQRLRPRSKAVLIIPSPYAYRDNERELIPANSVLRFDVVFRGLD